MNRGSKLVLQSHSQHERMEGEDLGLKLGLELDLGFL